uniref:Ig-like domain-containing protein n=1 Tax=Electrophorus electricus TaxID=8005 RepID=A0AAY5EPL6_ELEEL
MRSSRSLFILPVASFQTVSSEVCVLRCNDDTCLDTYNFSLQDMYGSKFLPVFIITFVTVLSDIGLLSFPFNKSRFIMKWKDDRISLTILNATEEDEGLYFCGVTDGTKVNFTSMSVVQHPQTSRVHPVLGVVSPGESVSLQCTVLSERRTAELRVLWFRAAAGDSHPEIIYNHHNSSCHCVYNLFKSVLSLSDTGTYYCTVATCGKILIGNGSTVRLSKCLNMLDVITLYMKKTW